MASLHRRQQTAAQLAAACGCSRQTILRHLKKAAPKAQFAAPQCANIVMDTTYFGRRFGIMVLFDSISGKALSVTEVKNETNALYAEAIGSLKAKGIEYKASSATAAKVCHDYSPIFPYNFAISTKSKPSAATWHATRKQLRGKSCGTWH